MPYVARQRLNDVDESMAPPVGEPVTHRGYMSFATHSGFGNQMDGLRNAIAVAKILGRVLVLPPLLRHKDLAAGRCNASASMEQSASFARRADRFLQTRASISKVMTINGLPTVEASELPQLSACEAANQSECAYTVAASCLTLPRMLRLLHQLHGSPARLLRFGSMFTFLLTRCMPEYRWRHSRARSDAFAPASVVGKSGCSKRSSRAPFNTAPMCSQM